MIARAPWIAAAIAALVSASPGGDVDRPRLDLSVEPGLGLYLSQAFGPKCRDTRGCAAGPSVAAQRPVRPPSVPDRAAARGVTAYDAA
jgi:hypothetical protein